MICKNCGASLGPEHFKPAPRVAVPLITGVRRVANGQEVISVVGGLELNTPVWANEMHEYPYLQWSDGGASRETQGQLPARGG